MEFAEAKGKAMSNINELVIFETKDNTIKLEVPVENRMADTGTDDRAF